MRRSLEEHVLGAAQTDTLCTKLKGSNCVVGRVGVGADTELAILVGPLHDAAELAGYLSVNCGNKYRRRYNPSNNPARYSRLR